MFYVFVKKVVLKDLTSIALFTYFFYNQFVLTDSIMYSMRHGSGGNWLSLRLALKCDLYMEVASTKKDKCKSFCYW